MFFLFTIEVLDYICINFDTDMRHYGDETFIKIITGTFIKNALNILSRKIQFEPYEG